MIKKISKKLHKKMTPVNFFDLPAEEQKKIIKKAVRGANKDQLDLMKEYERSLKLHDCSN